jgi:hypothetical protein
MTEGYVAVFSHHTGRVFSVVTRDREKLLRDIRMSQDDAEMLCTRDRMK